MINRSSAVMSQRLPTDNKLDYYPTPPWATRALMEHVIPEAANTVIWEPSCGEGWMATALTDYSDIVIVSDIFDYGYNAVVEDFLKTKDVIQCDWVITNPPFIRAEEFIHKSKKVASKGCAMLVRTSFIETIGRYERLFKDNPPALMAQFSERVAMLKERLDLSAGSATAYCWLVWKSDNTDGCKTVWIPPCKKILTTQGDIDRQSDWNRFAEVSNDS